MNPKSYSKLLRDDKLTIFLLHGVIDQNPFEVRNHNHKHIMKHEFEQLLEDLVHQGNPFSIRDLGEKKKIPPRAFIMTFDDGFENNWSIAAPLLKKFKVPAIFYVTSGFVQDNLMSWVDQIDYAIEMTHRSQIEIPSMQKTLRLWDRLDKIQALDDIRGYAKSNQDWFLNKDSHIREIFDVCGVKQVNSLNSSIDQKMKWSQVKELSEDHLFEIGGHTHTHAIMSYLNDEDLDYEISHCLDHILRSGSKFNGHFSYPEGSLQSYNEKVIAALKKHNIVCSPTAIEGQNDFHEDLFHLKRINVT